jgi:carboxypeptidase D
MPAMKRFLLVCTSLGLLSLPWGIFAFPHESDWSHEEFVARAAKTHKYLTNKTEAFAVDGANLPDIPFDIGESYAGLLPLNDSSGRELFFWFVPSQNPAADNEVAIWLNGGPGCSSMIGFLQENGPISWEDGTYAPVPNVYSWSNLTNVVWIEQPAGTGFSGYHGGKSLSLTCRDMGVSRADDVNHTGANASDEIDVATQFLGFWKNFIDTFDMRGRDVAIAGESYAGNYVCLIITFAPLILTRACRSHTSPRPCLTKQDKSLNGTSTSVAS